MRQRMFIEKLFGRRDTWNKKEINDNALWGIHKFNSFGTIGGSNLIAEIINLFKNQWNIEKEFKLFRNLLRLLNFKSN